MKSFAFAALALAGSAAAHTDEPSGTLPSVSPPPGTEGPDPPGPTGCPTVTVTGELCTTCVIPACLVYATATRGCDCTEEVATVTLDFPCEDGGCHGAGCATSWAVEEESCEPTGTDEPTDEPTGTDEPTDEPTGTDEPTDEPTGTDEPTDEPTGTDEPTDEPTGTDEPTDEPTGDPTDGGDGPDPTDGGGGGDGGDGGDGDGGDGGDGGDDGSGGGDEPGPTDIPTVPNAGARLLPFWAYWL